jgi:hypothetical protein
MTTLSGLVQNVPGFWGFCLQALGLVLSATTVVWLSIHRMNARRDEVRKKYAAQMYGLRIEYLRMLIESRDRRDLKLGRGDRKPEKRKRIEKSDPAPRPRRVRRNRSGQTGQNEGGSV